jgi:hypothetical protein
VNVWPDASACLDMSDTRVIYKADAPNGSHAFNQNSALRCTKVLDLSKIPDFNRISIQEFSTRFKSLIDSEYTEVIAIAKTPQD